MAKQKNPLNEAFKNESGVPEILTSEPQEKPIQPKSKEPERVIFRLKGGNKSAFVIDAFEDAINPKGEIERMRALTGVKSVWSSEQGQLSDIYIRQNKMKIAFENRILIVPAINKVLIEFLRRHNANVAVTNKVRMWKFEFEEYNPQAMALEAEKKQKLEYDAIQKAMMCDAENMKKHASYLGVVFVDEFGEPKLEETIRYEYVQKAKNNPELFLKTFKSELVETTFVIKKAISQGKIAIEGQKLYFAEGGQFIMSTNGETPLNALVGLATSRTNQGNEFYEQIKNIVRL